MTAIWILWFRVKRCHLQLGMRKKWNQRRVFIETDGNWCLYVTYNWLILDELINSQEPISYNVFWYETYGGLHKYAGQLKDTVRNVL